MSRPYIAAISLIALLCAAAPATAFSRFQAEIPNIPIVNGRPWPGVGHLVAEGGGARNAFGKDFEAAGYEWTPALCAKDSDGDGYSNGEELGDPKCTWQMGDPRPAPANGRSISHPGLKSSVPV